MNSLIDIDINLSIYLFSYLFVQCMYSSVKLYYTVQVRQLSICKENPLSLWQCIHVPTCERHMRISRGCGRTCYLSTSGQTLLASI